jgi:hypothetical protein
MRERAAEELNPQIGRMGAEDPSRALPAEPQTPTSIMRSLAAWATARRRATVWL